MNAFFFKQKTAYEMLRSLVGSEMCIRDSPDDDDPSPARRSRKSLATQRGAGVRRRRPRAPPSVESD